MSDTPETPEPAVRELIAAGEKATDGPVEAVDCLAAWKADARLGFQVANFGIDSYDDHQKEWLLVQRDRHARSASGSAEIDAKYGVLAYNLAPALARDWLALRERVTALEADHASARTALLDALKEAAEWKRKHAYMHAEATSERVRAEEIAAERDAAVARAEVAESTVETDTEAMRKMADLVARVKNEIEALLAQETTETRLARVKVAREETDSWRRKYEALRRSVDEGLNSGEGAYKP